MICTVWNADLNFFLLFPVQGQKERSKLWLCSKAAAVLLLLEVHSTGWRGNMLVGCLVWGNSDHRPCDISPFWFCSSQECPVSLNVWGAWVRFADPGALPLAYDLRGRAISGSNPSSCGEGAAVGHPHPFVPTQHTGVFHGFHQAATGRTWSCKNSIFPLLGFDPSEMAHWCCLYLLG